MLTPLLTLLLASQTVPIDSADVRAIVTAVVTDSLPRVPSILTATRGRPLLIDLERTNQAFERYAGHPLPPLTGLPSVMFWPRSQSEAVDCPPGITEVIPTCRVRGDAVWVHVTKVRDSDAPNELLVSVSVLWTTRMSGTTYLTGYESMLALRRTKSGWSVTRFLYAAVG